MLVTCQFLALPLFLGMVSAMIFIWYPVVLALYPDFF